MILKRVWYANGAVNIVIVVLVILHQVLLRVVHEESKMQVRSIQIEEQLQKPIQRSEVANIFITLNKCNTEKLEKMFRTCHALVLKNRPIFL